MNNDHPVFPYGAAGIDAVIKSDPEDFQVVEELGFEPGGDGEHLFLWIEKSGLSTPELVSRISRDYSIHPRQVSYSGLKDKNALTTQWLSLHMPGGGATDAPEAGDGYRVLRAVRHRSKLRRGVHKANFFRLRLRRIDDLPEASRQQLDAIVTGGMANYFGRQRFGARGDNVAQALQQLQKTRIKRARRGMLLSSLRSFLFNQVLCRRILLGYWDQPVDGDVFMLSGSHSIFSEPVDETLLKRYREMDISSSASLYGSGRNLLGGESLSIESEVFSTNPEITGCLEKHGAKLQMRALRVAVPDLDYEYDAARKTLDLHFRLPAGSYATSLLDHFVNTVEDV